MLTGSSTILAQDRLDVRKKSRSNLFNWRGQFTPQFVDYILDSFAESGQTVIDPFSGSGTVLQECSMKRMSCYGYEINPAAYTMSKFFTLSNAPHSERQAIFSSLEEKLLSITTDFEDVPLLRDKIEFRQRYENLIDFSKAFFSIIENKQERMLALNLLFMCEDRPGADIRSTSLQDFRDLRKLALSLPCAEKIIRAQLADARLTHKHCPLKADLLFTSPPYINVFNYHQNHRAILEAVGWDILKVARSEIGSNRKNRGNRFRTVIQYCLDIEQSLMSFWQSLASDGLIILVVGRESNVRGTPFYNGAIIREIMSRMDGFEEVTNRERKFTNRFGLDIREDIIISRRTDRQPSASHAREVALRHLESALPETAADVRADIEDAITCITEIEPSPLLAMQGLADDHCLLESEDDGLFGFQNGQDGFLCRVAGGCR
jgi:DNA modification methylase